MSNSSLVNYTKLSPNYGERTAKIDKITIHHMAGNLTVETCGNVFCGSRQASANYGIDSDGRVGLYVDEANRSWASYSRSNDNRAVTIEVANDGGAPDWHVSDKALAKLIDLCVDICQRNGIAKLNYTGDTSGNLTMHKWFVATTCPGPYLESKFPYIAAEVNKRLTKSSATTEKPATTTTLYRVQTGAFSKKANADALLVQIKAAGFDAIIVQADNLYKVQVGAFAKKANATAMASKLNAAGFATHITTKGGKTVAVGSVIASTPTIKKGSKVKVRSGARTYTGGSLMDFVYHTTYTVLEPPSGDRVVIGLSGVVTAAMHAKDLILIS